MTAAWWPLAALLLVPLGITALVPRPWLWIAILLWLVSPVVFYLVVVVGVAITDSGNQANTLHNALLGFSLLSAFLILPWLGVNAVAFGLGALLRRKRPPAPPPAPMPAPILLNPADSEAWLDTLPPPGPLPPALPHPLAAWRAALVILLGAGIAIGAIAWFSMPAAMPPKPVPVFAPPRLAL